MDIAAEGLQKDNLSKDYMEIKTINDDRREREAHSKDLDRCVQILNDLKNCKDTFEHNASNDKGIYKTLQNMINPEYLNSLPRGFEDFRRQIAFQLKDLSVFSWNIKNDIDLSFSVIKLAKQINLADIELGLVIKKDYDTVSDIHEQMTKMGTPIDTAPSLYTLNGCGTKIYGDTLFIVLLFIPIFPLKRYSLEVNGDSYRFFRELKLRDWQKKWKYGFFICLAIALAYLFVSKN